MNTHLSLKLTTLALTLGLSSQVFADTRGDAQSRIDQEQAINAKNKNTATIAQVSQIISALVPDLLTVTSYTGSDGVEVNNSLGTIKGSYTPGDATMLVANGVITGNYRAADTTVDITGNQIRANYQPGGGISIIGNEIIATGTSATYTGTGAIDIAGTVVSSIFTGSDGIIVDNAAATIKQTPYYSIGDQLQGGTIFYLDETKRHGLMLGRPHNIHQPASSFRPTGSTVTTGHAFAAGIGAGMINTQAWFAEFEADDPGANFDHTLIDNAVGLSLTAPTPATSETCTNTLGEVCYGAYYAGSLNEMQILFESGIVTGVDCGTGNDWAWTSSSVPSSPGSWIASSEVYRINMNPSSSGVSEPISIDTTDAYCTFPIRQF